MPISSQSLDTEIRPRTEAWNAWNPNGPSDLEENKEAYRRFIETAFNEGNLDQLDELLTADYKYQDAPPGVPPGKEAIRQVVKMFRAAFPDLKITFEDQIAERDMVCSRTIMTGTHRGEIFGMEPTGNSVKMAGLTLVRIAGGRVAESWVKNDVQTLMKQLNAK